MAISIRRELVDPDDPTKRIRITAEDEDGIVAAAFNMGMVRGGKHAALRILDKVKYIPLASGEEINTALSRAIDEEVQRGS